MAFINGKEVLFSPTVNITAPPEWVELNCPMETLVNKPFGFTVYAKAYYGRIKWRSTIEAGRISADINTEVITAKDESGFIIASSGWSGQTLGSGLFVFFSGDHIRLGEYINGAWTSGGLAKVDLRGAIGADEWAAAKAESTVHLDIEFTRFGDVYVYVNGVECICWEDNSTLYSEGLNGNEVVFRTGDKNIDVTVSNFKATEYVGDVISTTVEITENGEKYVIAPHGYAYHSVTVRTNVAAELEEKTVEITENGTTTITADTAEGLASVTVNTNVPMPTLTHNLYYTYSQGLVAEVKHNYNATEDNGAMTVKAGDWFGFAWNSGATGTMTFTRVKSNGVVKQDISDLTGGGREYKIENDDYFIFVSVVA